MEACAQWQDAISARMDGEDTGVPDAALDAHLRDCAPCHSFAARVGVLHDRMPSLTDVSAPDRSVEILAAVRSDERDRQPQREPTPLVARAGLGAVAMIQLLVALPDLWAVAGAHSMRDLGAFQLALAVGFLVAAIRPATAAGLLPTAAALALVLAVVVVGDVSAGRVAVGAESAHTTEWIGVALLWLVTRHHPARGEPRPA